MPAEQTDDDVVVMVHWPTVVDEAPDEAASWIKTVLVVHEAAGQISIRSGLTVPEFPSR